MQADANGNRGLFAVRRVPAGFILGLIGLEIIFALAVNLVFFEQGTFNGIKTLTNGWINPTLCAGLLGLAVIVVTYLLVIARIPLRELGLKRENLLPGCLGTLLFWIAVNVLTACMTLLAGDSLNWNKELAEFPNLYLGALLGQLFGNALLEEIIFRGFLFVQLYDWLSRVRKPSARILWAMLLTHVLFALMHIPNRIYSGYSGPEFVFDFVQLVLLGMLFALFYVLTENLFIVVGIHSLMNVNLSIWNSSYVTAATLTAAGLAAVLLLLLRRKKLQQADSVIHY